MISQHISFTFIKGSQKNDLWTPQNLAEFIGSSHHFVRPALADGLILWLLIPALAVF
jgi:hypothetical protein